MEISFRVRKPAPGLLPSLVGIFGLIAIAVAAGALIGNWWWTAMVGGVFAVAVAYLAGQPAEQAAPSATVTQLASAKTAKAG